MLWWSGRGLAGLACAFNLVSVGLNVTFSAFVAKKSRSSSCALAPA